MIYARGGEVKRGEGVLVEASGVVGGHGKKNAFPPLPCTFFLVNSGLLIHSQAFKQPKAL